MSELVRVGKTHCQGHQDPSKSVPVFERGTGANFKMVSINRFPFRAVVLYHCFLFARPAAEKHFTQLFQYLYSSLVGLRMARYIGPIWLLRLS